MRKLLILVFGVVCMNIVSISNLYSQTDSASNCLVGVGLYSCCSITASSVIIGVKDTVNIHKWKFVFEANNQPSIIVRQNIILHPGKGYEITSKRFWKRFLKDCENQDLVNFSIKTYDPTGLLICEQVFYYTKPFEPYVLP